MTQKISTVDVEEFRGTTFFSLTPHKPGNRLKVKDAAAHAAYLAQLAAEVDAARARKEGRAAVSLSQVSADGAAGNGSRADAGRLALTATKRLLVSEPLEELYSYLTEVKQSICGPFGPAQQSKVLKGLYVVRNDLIQTIEDQITQAQERITADTWIDPQTGDIRPGYIRAFLDDLPAAIERTRTLPLLDGGLGPLWNADDYTKLAEEWKDAFGLDSQYLALGIPEDLPPALKQKAAAKFEQQMTEAAEECKMAMRVSLGAFLDRLTERLADDPTTGKPKIFRDSLIENVRQFCAAFDARNFVNDSALADLVGKCRKILEDKTITPDKIRQYSSVRENTLAKFQEVKNLLDPMIQTKGGRQFALDDD